MDCLRHNIYVLLQEVSLDSLHPYLIRQLISLDDLIHIKVGIRHKIQLVLMHLDGIKMPQMQHQLDIITHRPIV